MTTLVLFAGAVLLGRLLADQGTGQGKLPGGCCRLLGWRSGVLICLGVDVPACFRS